MFKVLEPGARKRRVWSAGTVTLSVAAHVAILGVAAYASLNASPPPPRPEVVVDLGTLPPPPPPAPQPVQPDRPPPDPAAPKPVAGDFIEVHTPDVAPDKLPPLNAVETPAPPQDDPAAGKGGDVIGPPSGGPSTGRAGPVGDGAPSEVIPAEELGEIPALANTSEVQRILQRTYPPLLRDAGIVGEARLQFVINTDGRVDPATVQVVGATNEQFGDAARRAVEHFRFKPASMMGEPVRVLITIPIRFNVQH
jgi:protein TonB